MSPMLSNHPSKVPPPGSVEPPLRTTTAEQSTPDLLPLYLRIRARPSRCPVRLGSTPRCAARHTTHADRARRGRGSSSQQGERRVQTDLDLARGGSGVQEAARRSEGSPAKGAPPTSVCDTPPKKKSAGAAGAQYGHVVCSGNWCWVRKNGGAVENKARVPQCGMPLLVG